MDELGMIINQNGESMSFGKWRLRELRQPDHADDWHTDSFMQTVYPTKWFQDLGLPYNPNQEFHNQLDLFAKHGIIVLANAKENSKQVGESRIVMATPNSITDLQIEALMNKRNSLIQFEHGHISFIDVFDTNEDYVIVESFYSIKDYYHYLDQMLENKNRHTK
ncbi:MAG: hypothetical protein PUB18_03820 [bacterium]|nr:hypothetical protein [bacterium]